MPKSLNSFFMPRRTNLIKLISKLIATNYENDLEITPIICRQSFFYIASCISETFIFGSQLLRRFHWISLEKFSISFTKCLRMVPWTAGKNCGLQVFLAFEQFYCVIWLSKCLCDTPFAQFQFSELKKKEIKTFAYAKNENQQFLRYLFAKTEIIGKLWTPGILKIPQFE